MESFARVDCIGCPLEAWVMYPDFGRAGGETGLIRYEEYARRGDPFWISSHILIVAAQNGAQREKLLVDSDWRWAPPFEKEEIQAGQRRLIIERLRKAYEHMGYKVSTEFLEVSAGLRQKREEPYTVVLEGVVLRVTRNEDGAVKRVRVVDDGKEVFVKLSQFAYWDAPRQGERITTTEQGHIFTLAGLAVSKHSRSFVVDMERGSR